jgi:hypothetical protein
MGREEMTRIRRELGLDLVEAGRKAGVTAPSRTSGRMMSDSDDCEVDESLGLHFIDFQEFDAWDGASQEHSSYQVPARAP